MAFGQSGIHVGAAVGEDHVAGADDDRPQTSGVEGPAHVGGPSPLFAESGNEDPDVGHGGAEGVELLRPGGADDGADEAVGVPAGSVACSWRERVGGEVFDAGGDMFVEGGAVGFEILEVAAAGVRGFDENKQAGVAGFGGGHEGDDRVEAEVGIDGQGVAAPGAGEPAVGVGFGGGADVAPLAVGEDQQPAGVGVVDRVGQCLHAGGAEGFEAGELGLHDRDMGGDGVDDVPAEARVDLGEGRGIIDGSGAEGWGE